MSLSFFKACVSSSVFLNDRQNPSLCFLNAFFLFAGANASVTVTVTFVFGRARGGRRLSLTAVALMGSIYIHVFMLSRKK